jgi:HEAT repeat protein
LDEVTNESQWKEMAEKIESFVGTHHHNPVLITSRPIGYRRQFFDDKDFAHYVLEEFDRPKIEAFIENWYNSRIQDPTEAERRKVDLRAALDRKGQILQLAKNPLLITIIALIHRYQTILPQQRCQLYEKAVSTLLTTWDRGKSSELQLRSEILKPNDLLHIMKKVAHHIHGMDVDQEQEGGTLISKVDLIAEISKVIQKRRSCMEDDATAEAECFVDFIRKRTGLLNEQGNALYGFAHKTFQEYLTAEEIYSQFKAGDDEIIFTTIQTYLHHPHWREVLLLLISRLEGKRAANAIQTILKTESDYEQWLHRDLIFAAWCLTEDPEGLTQEDSALTKTILHGIIDLKVNDLDKVGNSIILETTEIIQCIKETSAQYIALEVLNQKKEFIAPHQFFSLQYDLGKRQEAIDALLLILRSSDVLMVQHTISALQILGNNSEEVITALIGLLDNSDQFVCFNTALALGELGNDSEWVITALLERLRKSDDPVSFSIAVALGKLGNDSEQVITALLSFLSDFDQFVRSKAAKVLGKLGNDSEQIITALLTVLNDSDQFVRSCAISALGELGNDSEHIMTALFPLLDDSNQSVRLEVAGALGKLGNDSEQVITSLLSFLSDSDQLVRFRATSALGKLGNDSEQVITALFSLLDDSNQSVRLDAAVALSELGNNSEQVITSLLVALKSSSHWKAANALGEISKNKIEIIMPTLVDWLDLHYFYPGKGSAIDLLKQLVTQSAGVKQKS